MLEKENAELRAELEAVKESEKQALEHASKIQAELDQVNADIQKASQRAKMSLDRALKKSMQVRDSVAALKGDKYVRIHDCNPSWFKKGELKPKVELLTKALEESDIKVFKFWAGTCRIDIVNGAVVKSFTEPISFVDLEKEIAEHFNLGDQ